MDGASLTAFRVLLGGLFAFSALRFVANGWVSQFFVTPTHFFSFWGQDWIAPLPEPAMVALFIGIAVLGLLLAAGIRHRLVAAALFVAFTYVELIDVTNYLNHYYLLSLLSFLVIFLPLGRAGDGQPKPMWALALIRFQVGAVYVFAGLAKANTDWLLHAQPLNIWLSSRTEAPLVGSLLGEVWVAYALSWAGFIHDLLIPFAVMWRRTRRVAFAVLVAFHVATGLLFTIGLFPVIMIGCATIFLSPSWPRPLWRRLSAWRRPAPSSPVKPTRVTASGPLSRLGLAAALIWCSAQVLVPLRTHLAGGDVLWHEQGMRWSWRVMVREKNGDVSYRVQVPGRDREQRVSPRRFLTPHQAREMSGQPDLIVQVAHWIRDDFAARGVPGVAVRVDAFASLNGRAPARLIDPTVDLTDVSLGLAAADWILAAPPGPPPTITPTAHASSVLAELP